MVLQMDARGLREQVGGLNIWMGWANGSDHITSFVYVNAV